VEDRTYTELVVEGLSLVFGPSWASSATIPLGMLLRGSGALGSRDHGVWFTLIQFLLTSGVEHRVRLGKNGLRHIFEGGGDSGSTMLYGVCLWGGGW